VSPFHLKESKGITTTSLRPTRTEMEAVDCSIVVVTYNSDQHIVPFLDSVGPAAGPLTWRVIVVDNGSSPRTAELVEGRPGVTYVRSPSNLGYSGGINIGRSHAAPCDSILIANPDVRLARGALAALHRAVIQGKHGAAVPVLLDNRGHLSRSLRREPTITRQLGESLFGDHFKNRPSWLSEVVRDTREYQQAHTVEWATGAVIMVSTECDAVVEDWDESYFLFSEEVDYAARIRGAGFSIAFVPEATAVHHEGGSGRPTPLMSLLAVNRLRYYRGRHGRVAATLYAAALLLQLLLRSAERQHRRAACVLWRVSLPAILWGRFDRFQVPGRPEAR
jgi:GT2 family glycosyltransferase